MATRKLIKESEEDFMCDIDNEKCVVGKHLDCPKSTRKVMTKTSLCKHFYHNYKK